MAYLSSAQRRGDLFVIVARDATVALVKGKNPVQTEQQRVQAVQAAFPGATVLLGDTDDYLKPVLDVRPDLVVLGYDQHFPPGVSADDLPCPVERAEPFEPKQHKSSLRKQA
ncbi:hypothetical protein FJZ28_02370 [Candidatus Peregrinibacteria bacterium]|nr:hypothetical protein [Candidatus Peregrinibacteria bacterium]